MIRFGTEPARLTSTHASSLRASARSGELSRRRLLHATGVLTAAALAGRARAAGAQDSGSGGDAAADLPDDFAVEEGHHYRQASGAADAGYEARNLTNARWWDAFRRLGATGAMGYPIGRPYAHEGFTYQPFQRALLQWSEAAGTVRPANVLEMLDQAGFTEWLRAFKNIPAPLDDGANSFAAALEIRRGWLTDEGIRAAYDGNPDPIRYVRWTSDDTLVRWGVPMSRPESMGPFVAQRFQRGVLQRWVEAIEGRPAPGTVTAVAIGDVMAEAGLLPDDSRTPVLSADAAREAEGRTAGERLQAAVDARLSTEPGTWAVFAAPLGASEALVARNADATMTAASLWKAAAMVEAFRQRAVDGLSFDTLLTMTSSVVERVDPPASLAPGQRISIEAALARSMSVSDNTTAILLADHLRYARIDETLQNLGLAITRTNSREPVTTAREIAALIEVAAGGRSAPWERTLGDVLEMRELLMSETQDDRIPARLPVGTPVAHKTGDLGGAVSDAGVVYASTGPIVIALLSDGVPDAERAAATGAELARIIYDALDPPTHVTEAPAG